ncbi:MAG: CHRD domain-containing protein [Burkholderiaceae bacterium]
MQSLLLKFRTLGIASALAAGLLSLNIGPAIAAETKVFLNGAEETPPVATAAIGNGTIKVNDDKSISGSISTKGLVVTAAHIHEAAAGKSGPPIISLTKTSDDVWSVPEGSKLTDSQFASYQVGNLYINAHSAENKRGEIRGQIKP